MDKRLAQLRREQVQLIERVASQRAVLADQLAPLQKLIAAGDRAAGWLDGLTRYLRRHPLPVLIAAAALVLFKPKAAWCWAQRGLFVWRAWRTWRVQRNNMFRAIRLWWL